MGRKRRCSICRSKIWHKDPARGIITCGEGHVLRDHRLENNEVSEFGKYAVRKRTMKSTRTRVKKENKAGPTLYRGERARYHYFQCLQLLLRIQIRKLMELWQLPQEFEIICRDTWAMHLSLLNPPPSTELYNHDKGEHSLEKHADIQDVKGEVPLKQEFVESELGHAQIGEDGTSSSSEDEIEGIPGMNELLQEAESDSSDEENEATLPRQQPDKLTLRKEWQKEDSPAGNIAVLIHTCWVMRLPIIYKDITDLIASYNLPYLDPIRFLPVSLTKHLTKQTKQALSPHFAPTPILLHTITSRLARGIFQSYKIITPELNAAPVLWRAVIHMGGNPTLYVVAKTLARHLELPLMLDPLIGPSVLEASVGDMKSHRSDNVPPEVAFVATLVISLKLIYGLDGKEVRAAAGWDPACTMPSMKDYFEQLRIKDASDLEAERSTSFPPSAEQLPQEWDAEAVDQYLNFCERALLGGSAGDNDERHGVGARFFRWKPAGGEVDQGPNTGRDGGEDGWGRETSKGVLVREVDAVSVAEEEVSGETCRPGELYTIFSAHDVLGTVPDACATVAKRAAEWVGISEDDLWVVVERFERRLARLWSRNLSKET